MNKNFLKYRNVITLNEDYNLSENQLIKLIEANVYVTGHVFPEEDFNAFVKEGESFHVDGTEILYNFYDYQLNNEIVDIILEEIYDLLQRYKKHKYSLPKEQIIFELSQYITHEDKLNYLKQKHAEIWNFSEYLKCTNTRSQFLRFYEKEDEEFFKSDDWLVWIWEECGNHNILRYLSTKDSIYNCFKEFVDKWVEYGRIKALSLYCKKLISMIENTSDFLTNTSNNKRLTTLEQVCYIDNLRGEALKFNNLTDSQKKCYLDQITGGINYDVNEQLKTLEYLVALSTNDFEILGGNYSAYARHLHIISKSDFRELRKQIANFDKPALLADNIKTSEDRKNYEAYKKIKKKIELANTKVFNLYKNLGNTLGTPH